MGRNGECPSEARLSDWLTGRVSEDDWEILSVHIEFCDSCQASLKHIPEDRDTIGRELRRGAVSTQGKDTDSVQVNEDTGTVTPGTRYQTEEKTDSLIDRHVGQYRVMEKIGQGGMGTVYRAVHLKLQKTVALKVLPPSALMDSESVDRFEREMLAIGCLDHVNIVGAHDAGEADGIHYLVMEFIDGEDLSSLVQTQGRLSPRSACRLIRQAACGLEYVHQQGLIHRDIKPSNLMLTAGPAKRVVKVLDLGLARLQSHPGVPATEELTSTGQVMGTIDFMAPEQALDTRAADERSDIYSLGITLFYLLTGSVPFKGETPMRKLLSHREAPRPVLSEVRRRIPPSVDRLFVRMAAVEVGDRFQSMTEVIQAIDECLNEIASSRGIDGGETDSRARSDTATLIATDPERALNDSGSYTEMNPDVSRIGWLHRLTGKTRRRIGAASAGFVAIAVIAVLIMREPGSSSHDARFTESSRTNFSNSSQPGPTGLKLSTRPGPSDNVIRGLVTLPAKLPGLYRWQIETTAPRGAVSCVAFSPDDRLIACSTDAGCLRVYDAVTLELKMLQDQRSSSQCVCWSPDGRQLATGDFDGNVQVWSVDGSSGSVLGRHGGSGVNSVAWSPDGKLIASAGYDQTVRLWSIDGNSGPVFRDHESEVLWVAWQPGTSVLASSGRNGHVQIRDISTGNGQVIRTEGSRFAWTIDGDLIVASDTDVRLWSARDGLKTLAAINGAEKQVVSSPDGQRFACTRSTGGCYVVDRTGGAVFEFGGSQNLRCCDWSHDGQRIVTAGLECAINVWDRNGVLIQSQQGTSGHAGQETPLAWSPDGSQLLTGGDDHLLRLWNSRGEATVISPHGDEKRSFPLSVSWNPDSNILSSVAPQPDLCVLWSLDQKSQQKLDAAYRVRWSSQGQLAGFSRSGPKVWDDSGKVLTTFNELAGEKPLDLTWSPDGRQLGFLVGSGPVQIWTNDGQKIRELSARGSTLSWSPAGDWIAVWGGFSYVRLITPDGKPGSLLNPGGGQFIAGAAWSPNGEQVVVSTIGDRLSRWNLAGKQQDQLAGSLLKATGLDWSRTGGRIAAANGTHRVVVWDAKSGQPLWSAVTLPNASSVTFTPSGQIRFCESVDIEQQLVYVAETAEGQRELLTPSEFQASTGLPLMEGDQ